MTSPHPTSEQLRAFALGQLNPDESALIERHVEYCQDCCQILNEVPDDEVLKLLKLADMHRRPDTGHVPPDDHDTPYGSIPPALRDHTRYRIIKVLGDGGMGVVYKAEHRLMARLVALKVINRRLLSNPLAVERFRREFKAAARLTHPNIVVAHDADEAGGLHFLVMEYVDGVSLAQYVERKGPLPVATACFFIRQAALGLQHAAQQGMVHRDIKPQNLMLTRKGQIKVLDFGLARFASEGAALSGPQSTLNGQDDALALTQAGMIVGTPDYMAPEQAVDSSQADIRADLYSLGCTFFFLLTGQPPFAGNSVASTLDSHAAHHPPDLQMLRKDLPPDLVRIINRMMAKSVPDRIQTPGEVAKLLTKFAVGGLAAASSSDIAASISATPPTAVTDTKQSSSEHASPSSTFQLLRQGRWQSAAHRVQRALWSGSRSRPYQIATGCALVLLLGFGAVWMGNSNRPGDIQPSVTPANVVQAPEAGAVKKGPVDEKKIARIALVLTRRNFWSRDYLFLRDALERRGAAITLVSSRVGPVTSEAQMESQEEPLEVHAEVSFSDIRPDDFHAIVFIPSSNSEFIYDSDAPPQQGLAAQQTYARVLKELSDARVCLAALGNAVNLLARYGLLDDQQATGPDWVAERSEYAAVHWDTAKSVIASGPDGQFVTAWNVSATEPFAARVYASSLIRTQPSP